ncbi:MAG: hypothetical protein HYS14_07695, partial [Candidatus Rokubacteria bacterium]|nr:hypothetical protein [Candidatus Rokubacteria bacterium]
MKRWILVALSVLLLAGLTVPVPADAQCQLKVPAIKIGVQGAGSGPH